jgi:two-component system response regulator HydG
MSFRSIKSKWLLSVSLLVFASGAAISLFAARRYSHAILRGAAIEAENLSSAIALEAADKVLTNDLVGLQRMIDHHMRSNPALAYLFVVLDRSILAHSFPEGMPVALVDANRPNSDHLPGLQKITSSKNESYLDIAYPIFEGKAGTLRLGYSERPYRLQVRRLWIQMGGLSLVILMFALLLTLFLVRRITTPIRALADATKRVNEGDLRVRAQVSGRDELAALASSFNGMVARMEEYTGRLEAQTRELERAHRQIRTYCSIVQEVGGLRSLKEIGLYLIATLKQSLTCGEMALVFVGGTNDLLFIISPEGLRVVDKADLVAETISFLNLLENAAIERRTHLIPSVMREGFADGKGFAFIPIKMEEQTFSALTIACPGDCRCDMKDIESAGMILNQTASVLKRAVLQEEQFRELRTRLEMKSSFSGIVGRDPKMQVIYKLIEDIGPTDATVLIQGESGTGKEIVARAIHRQSLRKDGPFVVINCSAYPSTLLESELFGHEKGAFTGAVRQKPGRFEQADGGTVFLDEIGEIPPEAQIKLLRIIQTHKFERLGGEKTIAVNVRIIAATNKDLLEEVKGGRFREDLYYRLSVIPLHLPPLRERKNDIPLLAHHFLRHFATEQGKDLAEFSVEAMRLLMEYSWPGNVRELENSIEHAVVLSKGTRSVEVSDLPSGIPAQVSDQGTAPTPTMAQHERDLLKQTLEACGWNKKEAARRLGISRSTLYEKLRKHHLTSPIGL